MPVASRAGGAVRELLLVPLNVAPERLAQAPPFLHAQGDGFVEQAAGFLRHSEPAGVDFGVHLLGGVAHEG